ncbi:MAG: hypothetical protein GY932_10400, partial [Arcobacter sp.]|nr:hypothetical protein [Arcobacter sp.]
LITLPFWDHIAGYVYFKYLCFTKGGVKIYKTVDDLQEQKDYWFYEGLNVANNSYKGKKFDFFADNNLIKRGIYYKDTNTDWKFKIVYLNYCNNKYNNLKAEDKNYKKSCKSTDEIIKTYDLKNVIKVPRSNYSFYNSIKYKENYMKEHYLMNNLFKILPLGFGLTGIINKNTNEVMGEFMNFTLNSGWYINSLATLIGFNKSQQGCNYYGNSIKLQEKIIPNPYKQNK